MLGPRSRIYAVAFLVDFAVMAMAIGIPFFIFKMGYGTGMSGGIGALQAISYAGACLLSARFVTRVKNGLAWAALGTVLYAALGTGRSNCRLAIGLKGGLDLLERRYYMIREKLQEEIQNAMRAKDSVRLDCLRMAKGAVLLKEKESSAEVSEEAVIAVLRAEIKKRQQSIEIFREVGREAGALAAENEIRIIEEFLPKQLSVEELEARVRAYLGEHPELNHAGKLTGAMKKELGDLAEGKMLNEVCKRLIES